MKTTQTQRTREIFLDALDRAPGTRVAFVEAACAGDGELRKRVEALLAESEVVGDFLQGPAAQPSRGDGSAKPGDQIGRYRLLEQIGEGGAGVVFMAEQIVPVRRRVALKVLKLGMDTRQVVTRFEAERQALAMMDHANIAAVFDAGATETGRPYFVMELVRGTPITTYCDERNLSVGARLKLFTRVCHAIQHAHQKGVIHRDIKPSNILVTESEGGAIPKVIDFGIAKAIEQPLTDKTLFTEFRALIGTPAYMSPEQLDMAGADVDTRSDIYSLGVLLYEMLTGQTPFAAKSLMQSGVDEFRRAVREVEPERPSSRVTHLPAADLTTTAKRRGVDDRSLGRALRGELDWIAMKCLEKDRGRRYATVNDLAADVRRFLHGEPVLARAPTTVYRLQKFLSRHRVAVGAATVVVLALVSASAISFEQAAAARRAKLRAEAESRRAQQNEARALLNEYVADITLAQQALGSGNFGRAHSLLAKHKPAPGKSDLRGFEWGYLTRLAEGDAHDVLIESGDSVRSVAFSSDGKLIAVGAREKASIFNRLEHSIVGLSTGGVFSVTFAADNARLYVADHSSIRVMNLKDRSEEILGTGFGAPIAISADGKYLAAGSREGVRVFQTSPWASKRTLFRTSGPLAFAPGGKTLITSTRNGFSVWPLVGEDDPVEIAATSAFGFFHQFARTLVIDPDNKRLYAPADKLVNVFDVTTGQPITTIPSDGKPLHSSAIAATALSADGKLLATASWDHSIQLWEANNYTHLRSLRGHRNEVWSLAFSPDGKWLLSGAKDGGVFLWPLEARSAEVDTIAGDWQPIRFSADEKTLAVANRRSGAIGMLNVETGLIEEVAPAVAGQTGRTPGPPGARGSISADFNVFLQNVSERSLRVIDRALKSEMILGNEEPIFGAIISPNGHIVAANAWGGNVIVWEIKGSTNPIARIRGDRGFFTHDSKKLVAVGRDGTVSLWNAGTREIESSFALEIPPGFGGAISPDNRILAVGAMPDLSNTILLLDLNTGKAIGTLFGHKQAVGSIAFSGDGKTLASASSDGALKLWNIPTLQEILTLPTAANALVFSPRDGYLAFASRANNAETLQILHGIAGGNRDVAERSDGLRMNR